MIAAALGTEAGLPAAELTVTLLAGDCLLHMGSLPSNSLDALVTDPPAGIGFMGKDWDHNKGGRDAWVAWLTEVMAEALRVLKPGAHGVVWALPRTSHWTATALENAGFEIRDIVHHACSQRMPKSLNLGKAMQKAGLPHEVWADWGSSLKPAMEHWILVRKPITEANLAANVSCHGTGGLNIGASRIATGEALTGGGGKLWSHYRDGTGDRAAPRENTTGGRFPSNLVLSHHPECRPDGSRQVKSNGSVPGKEPSRKTANVYSEFASRTPFTAHGEGGKEIVAGWECHPECAVKNLDTQSGRTDEGGASRYFKTLVGETDDPAGALIYARLAAKKEKGADNPHPTVKSQALMRYLLRLVVPAGGVALDPFMGTGSTGVAATSLGLGFVGIEAEGEYFALAQARLAQHSREQERVA